MFHILKYGEYAGLSIEEVAIRDYESFLALLEAARQRNFQELDVYQKELEEVARICNSQLVSVLDCPICKAKKVRYISVRSNSKDNTPSISSNYCCCEDEECKSFYKVVGRKIGSVRFFSLKISNTKNFNGKYRKKFIKTLKFLLGIDRFDAEGMRRLFYPGS